MQEQGQECRVDGNNDDVYQKTMASTAQQTKQQKTLNDVMAACISSMFQHRVTNPYHSILVVYSMWCTVKEVTVGCCLH